MLAQSGLNITVDGSKVPYYNFSIVESFNLYYHYVSFTTSVYLASHEIVIDTDIKEKYYVLSTVFRDGKYTYTAIPESTHKLIDSIYPAVTGSYSNSQLCAKLGIPTQDLPTTNQVFWIIPSLSLLKLLQFLDDYSSIQNGGGVKHFINLKGKLTCVDLKRAFSDSAIEIPVGVESDLVQTDWMTTIGGSYNLIVASNDKIKTSPFIINSGVSSVPVYVNDTTGHAYDLVKQSLHNLYWRNYYTSREVKATFAGTANIGVGSIVSLNRVPTKFIIGEKVTILNSNLQTTSIVLKLFTNA